MLGRRRCWRSRSRSLGLGNHRRRQEAHQSLSRLLYARFSSSDQGCHIVTRIYAMHPRACAMAIEGLQPGAISSSISASVLRPAAVLRRRRSDTRYHSGGLARGLCLLVVLTLGTTALIGLTIAAQFLGSWVTLFGPRRR